MDLTLTTEAVPAPAADENAAPADDPSHSPGSPQPPGLRAPEAVRAR